jgi:hypothetical protein
MAPETPGQRALKSSACLDSELPAVHLPIQGKWLISSSTSRNALEKTMFTDTKRLENECASKLQAGAMLDEVSTR